MVLILLTKLIAQRIDALTLKCLIHVALLRSSDTERVVSVHVLALLPEVLSLLDNVSSHIEDSLIVLDHQCAIVVFGVLRL